MGVLNNLILYMNMTIGEKVNLYIGFYVLGFLTIFVFNIFYGKKYGIKKGKALLVGCRGKAPLTYPDRIS